jgi:hypothetical protein
MNKINKTYKDYLSNLLSFLDAKEESSEYDVDQVLTDAGYNTDEVGKRFQFIANQSMARSPNNWRNRSQIAHESAKKDYLQKNSTKKTHRSRSELMDAINTLMTQQNLKVAIAHRNFSNQTDEDLESLLNQLEYMASQKPNDTEE